MRKSSNGSPLRREAEQLQQVHSAVGVYSSLSSRRERRAFFRVKITFFYRREGVTREVDSQTNRRPSAHFVCTCVSKVDLTAVFNARHIIILPAAQPPPSKAGLYVVPSKMPKVIDYVVGLVAAVHGVILKYCCLETAKNRWNIYKYQAWIYVDQSSTPSLHFLLRGGASR